MKKLLFLFAATIGLVACSRSPKTSQQPVPQYDRVEVLSFHGKQRCVTCLAIEQLTRDVVENEFAAQVADSSLVFRVVDITQEETFADRYQVTWSSLLLTQWQNGEECVCDLTEFAFANARTNPDAFKAEIQAKIAERLK